MRRLKYTQLARLRRGDVFTLSADPADDRTWEVERHEMIGGVQRTRVVRTHEAKTLRRQIVESSLMVYVDITEDEVREQELAEDEYRRELEAEAEAMYFDRLYREGER